MKNAMKKLRALFLISFISIVLFLLFTYIISMSLGMVIFLSLGGLTTRLTMRQFPIYVFSIFLVAIPTSINIRDIFIILWTIYLSCICISWIGPRESFVGVIEESSNHPFSLLKNALFALPILASMSFSATVLLQYLLEAYGVPTGSIEFPDPLRTLLILTYSPIAEEFGSRAIPIGAFMIVYLFQKMKKTKLALISWKKYVKLGVLSMLYPESAKKEAGIKNVGEAGMQGISIGEWIMVLLTSILFAIAHYLGGWGPGKIITTLIVGLVFGLSYLIYGVWVPILLHWFFNYYMGVYWLATLTHPGKILFFVDIIQVLNVGFGLVGWLIFLALAVRKIMVKVHF